jgi:hypothetical protein
MNGIRPAFFHSDWNLIALNTKLSIQTPAQKRIVAMGKSNSKEMVKFQFA